MPFTIVETKEVIPSDANAELQAWATEEIKPLWNKIAGDTYSPNMCPRLIVSGDFGNRAYVLPRPIQTQEKIDSDTPIAAIYLPSSLVEPAKKNEEIESVFYSGMKVLIPAMTHLKYVASEELYHTLSDESDRALDEAHAMRVSCEQVLDAPMGKELIALYISRMLIEANILKLAEIHEYTGQKLPFQLPSEALTVINNELDLYFANPEMAKQAYMNMKTHEAETYSDDLDVYPDGFVRLYV